MTRLNRIKVANYFVFQVGWFACVLGAAWEMPWLALVLTAPVLALHLFWSRRASAELKLLTVCLLTGLLFDALLLASGWVAFPNGWWLPGLAPYWMGCMWLIFGTTLNLSLSWLRTRPLLAGGFGAVGGPLAYLAGQELGGITLVETAPAIAALAVGWGLVMPLLATAARKWDGFEAPNPPAFIHSGFDSKGASQNA